MTSLDRIQLVQGDTLPYINLTLYSTLTNQPIDISPTDVQVHVYFKKVGTSKVLSTILCEKIEPTLGKVRFCFANGELNVTPGSYEAEIEVDYVGQIQTIFDTLKFSIRSQF